MAGLDRVPAMDVASTIAGGSGPNARVGVKRSLLGGFGGTTPIQAHGDQIPADLYGLHQEELLKQPAVTLGAGLIPRADFGLRTPADLVGLRSDLIKRLGSKLPRGVE